jgi:HEAT repeat protein
MRPARLLVVILMLAPWAQSADPIEQRVQGFVKDLQSSDPNRRDYAASELRKMGALAKDAAPALAKALDETEWWVASDIVKALEAMAPHSIGPVAKMLKSKTAVARIRAASLLEKWGAKASGELKLMLPALKDDEARVRLAVAKAIGECGESAAPGCYRLLTARDPDHREAAAVALAGIGSATFTKLRTTLKGKNDFGRAGAATALGYAGAEEAIDDLAAATRDDEDFVREQAVLALGRIQRRPDASIGALLRAMGDKSDSVRRAAVKGAVLFGPDGARQLIAVLDLVADPARPGAIEALAEIGEKASEAIDDGLESKSPGIRAGCAEAIGGMDLLARIDLAPVAGLLEDGVPEVRAAAARSLAMRGKASKRYADEVRVLLKDEKAAVRLTAARALGAIASDGETVKTLEAAMKDKDGRVRIAAHHARARVSGGYVDLVAALRKIMSDGSATMQERIDCAQVCRDLMHGAATAVPDLITLLDSPDPGLQRAAVDALGSIASAHATGIRGRRMRYERAPKPNRDSIEVALNWLANHQDTERSGVNLADGRWDAALFVNHHDAGVMKGIGGVPYSDGVTGMALSAFLAVGYLDRGADQPYAKNIAEGLAYLRRVQMSDGCLSTTKRDMHFMLVHGFATIAMCEAWILTGDPRYGDAAQRALDFSCAARNPFLAWRYEPRGGENDTDVTAVILHGIDLGARGGLRVDPGAFAGADQWIRAMTDRRTGQIGYNMRGGSVARPEGLQEKFPPEHSQAMTAAGLWCRLLLGRETIEPKLFNRGVDLCKELLPRWGGGRTDMYYWYFASMVFAQVKEKEWRKKLESMLLRRQRDDNPAPYTGSWDPAGPWGPDGGRVYSTAINVMALAAPYRYARGFWESPKPKGAFADALSALKSASGNKDFDGQTRALAKRWLERIGG